MGAAGMQGPARGSGGAAGNARRLLGAAIGGRGRHNQSAEALSGQEASEQPRGGREGPGPLGRAGQGRRADRLTACSVRSAIRDAHKRPQTAQSNSFACITLPRTYPLCLRRYSLAAWGPRLVESV